LCDDGEIQDNYIEDLIQKEWCFQGEGKWGNLMRGLVNWGEWVERRYQKGGMWDDLMKYWDNSIQCYCRKRREGVMWVSWIQDEVQEDFYYLRRGIEGGMWCGCYWGQEIGGLWESWRD